MPPKKRIKKTPLEIDKVYVVPEEVVQELVEKFCNHRNMHAEGDVRCILPKGHKGDHSDGKYSWSDAAGTPPRKHG
jgi:hypothetical protein